MAGPQTMNFRQKVGLKVDKGFTALCRILHKSPKFLIFTIAIIFGIYKLLGVNLGFGQSVNNLGLVKFGAVATEDSNSVKLINEEQKKLVVFPNPISSGFLHFKLTGIPVPQGEGVLCDWVVCRIYNLSGQMLDEFYLHRTDYGYDGLFNVGNLPSGIYFAGIFSEQPHWGINTKFIVLK